MVKSYRELYVYEAKYRYNPADHGDDDDSYILIDPGDTLEVPGKNLEGPPENPQSWLMGFNVTKNLKGLFPGPYVKYLGIKGPDGEVIEQPPNLPPIPPKPKSTSTEPLPSEMPQVRDEKSEYMVFEGPGKPYSAVSQTPVEVREPKRAPPGVPHRLTDCYFLQPVICFHCNDYIWGMGRIGKKCEGCGRCCHNLCEEAILKDCSRTKTVNYPTYDRTIGLEEWTTQNVVDWMAALNLYRYAEVFRDNNISGKDLLQMSWDKLKEMGIMDEFHIQSLMICIDELCGRDPDEPTIIDRGRLHALFWVDPPMHPKDQKSG